MRWFGARLFYSDHNIDVSAAGAHLVAIRKCDFEAQNQGFGVVWATIPREVEPID